MNFNIPPRFIEHGAKIHLGLLLFEPLTIPGDSDGRAVARVMTSIRATGLGLAHPSAHDCLLTSVMVGNTIPTFFSENGGIHGEVFCTRRKTVPNNLKLFREESIHAGQEVKLGFRNLRKEQIVIYPFVYAIGAL